MSKVSFEGRVAIVTGAGGGLGREYALELARRGARVVINDLGTKPDGSGAPSKMADAVVAEIVAAGGMAIANHDSVASARGGEAIIAAALDTYGRLDVLINNAGTLRNARFEDLPDSTVDAMLDVHLKGAFYVTRPAFRAMKARGYGRILFASSAAGVFGNAEQAAYGAAKAGVVGLMNVLSQEGQDCGVLCNALLPTAESRMSEQMSLTQLTQFGEVLKGAAHLVGNTMSPAFVAPLAVYLVSEVCKSTHGIYSASLGRYAQIFIAMGDGWLARRDTTPSVDEIAQNFTAICARDPLAVPFNLTDEFAHIVKQLQSQ